ncbi:Arm DNA-binding domain-containing protein [Synechococcus sp. UW140]|uniref:Arm DNA-binding domain-containing protein n=1 Tax=Synechococcus sp. UW140 TaxID=368503 RepID=UPI0025D8A2C5|nr:Arm DNA-binding domain-containing protein [Synechococcus sp. UW140]
MTLTDVQIKAEAPGGVRRRVSDGGGLLLEIDPAGGKYWIWRHRYPPSKDGKQQDYRIGPYPKISLKKARQIRDEQRKRMLIEGINPCAAKRQEKVERFTSESSSSINRTCGYFSGLAATCRAAAVTRRLR